MTSPRKPLFSPLRNNRQRVSALQWTACAIVLVGVAGASITPRHIAALRTADITQLIAPKPAGQTGNYLAGRFAAANGDFDDAARFLNNTLQFDPKNQEIEGYTYRMSLINGDMENAVRLAKNLYAAKDESSNPVIMVLLEKVKEAQYKDARALLKQFDQAGFNLVVVPLLEGWIDLAENKIKNPLKQSESLRRLGEFAPFIYYQTAIINDLAGFEEEALVQYNEALASAKKTPYRVVEMMANLYQRRGEADKAEALFTRYREKNPDAAFDLPAVGTDKPARLISTPVEGIAEIFFSTAGILHSEGLNDEALIYIHQVLYLRPDMPAALLMRGTILEDSGRLQAAVAAYDAVPEGSAYFPRAQLRKAYTLNEMQEPDKAVNLLTKLERTLANPYQAQLARGDILMRLKRYEEAAKAYSKALEGVKKPTATHWPVLYARGICYERMGKWELAEPDFQLALRVEPEQPDVMNYLGYSWLVRGENLEQARALLEKAVLARPADGHIIDSMGWALYLSGDYAEAAEYLERAIELMPVDPTVNDHLGDVYWRLGRKNEARFQWKRALLFNPEKELAEALDRKLAEGLPQVENKNGLAGEEQEDAQQRAALRP